MLVKLEILVKIGLVIDERIGKEICIFKKSVRFNDLFYVGYIEFKVYLDIE